MFHSQVGHSKFNGIMPHNLCGFECVMLNKLTQENTRLQIQKIDRESSTKIQLNCCRCLLAKRLTFRSPQNNF